jgi:hypothetical protein
LHWVTTSEIESDGFWVTRSLEQHGPYERLPEIAFIPTTGAGSAYAAFDDTAEDGQVYWYGLIEGKSNGDERPLALRAPIFFPTVTLESFLGRAAAAAVQISWTTGPEFGTVNFELWRGDSADGPFDLLIAEPTSQGDGVSGATYVITDSAAIPTQAYWYQLIEIKQEADERPLTPILFYPASSELESFQVSTSEAGIELSWVMSSEIELDGFVVRRGDSPDGPFAPLPYFTPAVAPGATYTLTDDLAAPGQAYWYQLAEVKLDGDQRPFNPPLAYPATSQLADFTAVAVNEGVQLNWQTATEIQSSGFLVRRSQNQAGPYEWLTEMGFIPAQGVGSLYEAVDATAVAGQTYWYQLVERKLDDDLRPIPWLAPTYFPTVVLESFIGRTTADDVQISWETGPEFGSAAFQLWRGAAADGPFDQLIAERPATGNGGGGAAYSATDNDTAAGQSYWYQLVEIKQDAEERPLTPRLPYWATSTQESLTAVAGASGTQLQWRMTTELAAAGFRVMRSEQQSGPYELVANINLIPAAGAGTLYTAVDSAAVSGSQYWYQLREIKTDGDERSLPLIAPNYFPTVELEAFGYATVANGVRLSWTTGAEYGSQGFQLWRSAQAGGPYVQLTEIGLVTAVGDSEAGADYEVVDGTAVSGQAYWYELVEIKTDGAARPLAPRLHYPATAELALFTAVHASGGVQLNWQTTSESGSAAFLARRLTGEDPNGAYELLPISQIPATGAGSSYMIVDSTAVSDENYWYELVEIKQGGDQRTLPLRAPTRYPDTAFNSFTAVNLASGVELHWTTGPEFGAAGFWVERRLNGQISFTRLTAIGLVPATGDGLTGASYTALDNSAVPGQQYEYRLVERKIDRFPLDRPMPVEGHLLWRYEPPTFYLFLPVTVKP